nr:hypothetical protein [Bacteroides fragilis]
MYKRVIRPVYDDLFEQADCGLKWQKFIVIQEIANPINLISRLLICIIKEGRRFVKRTKEDDNELCTLHFAMQDEHLQQFIPHITLNNHAAVLNKMLYLGEYIRENWNKISNKAEYCLAVY